VVGSKGVLETWVWRFNTCCFALDEEIRSCDYPTNNEHNTPPAAIQSVAFAKDQLRSFSNFSPQGYMFFSIVRCPWDMCATAS
jgi:hypothetical protein